MAIRTIVAWALMIAFAAALCPALASPSLAASEGPEWARLPHHGHGSHAVHGECHAGDCCADALRAKPDEPASPAATLVAESDPVRAPATPGRLLTPGEPPPEGSPPGAPAPLRC